LDATFPFRQAGRLDTGRWLVGPTVELHLPFRLSFEVDGLYRQDKFQLQTSQSAPPNEWFSGGLVSVINMKYEAARFGPLSTPV